MGGVQLSVKCVCLFSLSPAASGLVAPVGGTWRLQ